MELRCIVRTVHMQMCYTALSAPAVAVRQSGSTALVAVLGSRVATRHEGGSLSLVRSNVCMQVAACWSVAIDLLLPCFCLLKFDIEIDTLYHFILEEYTHVRIL